jgi:hypothetical protein
MARSQHLHSKIKFGTRLNRLLSRLNLAVVKNTTLSTLEERSSNLQLLQSKRPPEGQPCLLDAVEKLSVRITQLETASSRIAAGQSLALQAQIESTWKVIDFVEGRSTRSAQFDCFLCGGLIERDSLRPMESQCIFGGGLLQRWQCEHCDVISGPLKMLDLTASQLSDEYASHFRANQEDYSIHEEIRAFHALDPVKRGRYLNYGCGGNLSGIESLRAEGWDVWGFEPSLREVPAAEFVLRSRDELAKHRFDGIFSNNVLEHFRFPVEELGFMRSLLNGGGKMSHATPGYEYLYEYTRFHLFFYSGRSREVLGRLAGLELVDYVSDGIFKCGIYAQHSHQTPVSP